MPNRAIRDNLNIPKDGRFVMTSMRKDAGGIYRNPDGSVPDSISWTQGNPSGDGSCATWKSAIPTDQINDLMTNDYPCDTQAKPFVCQLNCVQFQAGLGM